MNFLIAASQALVFGYLTAYICSDGFDSPSEAGWAAVCGIWSLIGVIEVCKDGRRR